MHISQHVVLYFCRSNTTCLHCLQLDMLLWHLQQAVPSMQWLHQQQQQALHVVFVP